MRPLPASPAPATARRRSLAATLIFGPLVACERGLRGDWEGPLTCERESVGEVDLDVLLDLKRDGGAYAGEMWWEGETEAEGLPLRFEETDSAVATVQESDGSREVDLTLTCLESVVYLDGEIWTRGCPEADAYEQFEARWDGANRLDLERSDCAGELRR